MFPIRDHNPSGRTPYVTYVLIAVNVAVFLAYWYGLPSDRAIERFFQIWGLVPLDYTDRHELHGFFTSMFLHGGWMHLLGNMLFLWIFGDNLEDEMGHLPYLAFYLLSGIAAGALQVASDPDSPVPMVGASGAIAGVMGAYLLLFPRARVDVFFFFIVFFRVFPVPAWIMLGIWFALQVGSGVVIRAEEGGVARWAHAGGFVAGLVLAFPLWLIRGGPAFWNRTHGRPPHPEATYPASKSRIPSVRRMK
jgi:membrane associated rhomboid family serine protease